MTCYHPHASLAATLAAGASLVLLACAAQAADAVAPSAPATDAGNLARTSELPAQVALNETYNLPSSVGDIAPVRGLKYVKTKDKVFLIVPTNRIVVDEIPD